MCGGDTPQHSMVAGSLRLHGEVVRVGISPRALVLAALVLAHSSSRTAELVPLGGCSYCSAGAETRAAARAPADSPQDPVLKSFK